MWVGATVIVVAVLAVGGWRVFRAGSLPRTVAQVAKWLGRERAGCEVTVESKQLPTPIRFATPERGFMDAASEVKFINCEHLGGSIFYYRFA
jgi:hypothetical protein